MSHIFLFPDPSLSVLLPSGVVMFSSQKVKEFRRRERKRQHCKSATEAPVNCTCIPVKVQLCLWSTGRVVWILVTQVKITANYSQACWKRAHSKICNLIKHLKEPRCFKLKVGLAAIAALWLCKILASFHLQLWWEVSNCIAWISTFSFRDY